MPTTKSKSILELPIIEDTNGFWVLGSKQGTAPEQTFSGRYPLSIVAIGYVLKGDKENEAAIKAVINPSRGDAYRALDTGHFWVFDGTQWNDIGVVVPSDVALRGGSDKTLQQVDVEKVGVTNGETVAGFYIATNGNPTALSAWKYTKYRNNDLTKIKLKGTAYGSLARTVAFYNSYDTISSATYITGYTYADAYGDTSGAGVNFDKEIAIPVGTKCIAVTDRLDGNIQMYNASINKWKPYDGNMDEGKYIIVDSGSYPSITIKELKGEQTESVMTRNGYVRRSDGVFVSDTLNICSQPIEVGDERFYIITELASSLVAGLVFYDENNTFISAAPQASVYGEKVTVQKPANAKYYVIGRLRPGVNGINYDFSFRLYQSFPLELKDDEVAFVSNKFVDKIVKVKESYQATRFNLTDRNDNTFIGSMNTVIDAFLAKKPNLKIIIESNFTEDLMPNGNGNGRKIIEFQKLLANYWGVQFIDISSKLGLVKRGTINTLQTFIKDGTHPADYPIWDVDGGGNPRFTAVNAIARYVADEMKPLFDDWSNIYGVCIGTSIPDGYPYTGNPNAQYPLIVANRLGCQIKNIAVSGSVVRVKRVDGSLIPSDNTPFLSLDSSVNYYRSVVLLLLGITDKGSKPTSGEITSITDAEVGDFYRAADFNVYFLWDGTTWYNMGSTKPREPDFVWFSHGRNDFQLDDTDFDINTWNLTL